MKYLFLTAAIIFSLAPLCAQEKKAVFITGTGRSGTSCTAGLLEIMGLELGSSLCGPNPYNKKGGFEDTRISSLNALLFKKIGMNSFKPLYHIDWSIFYNPFKNSIKEALGEYYNKFNIYGIKDPGISYLLPAYIGAAKELGYVPKIIIVLRHPKEIASSFARRWPKFQKEDIYQLMSVNLMSLVEFAQGEDVLVVHYDDILQDAKKVVQEIHAFLPELSTYDQVRNKLEQFIDEKLKHEYKG